MARSIRTQFWEVLFLVYVPPMHPLESGSFVRHPKRPNWQLGKVLHISGDDVYIYFSGMPGDEPESRVARFSLSAAPFELVTGVSDPELENLPPFVDGKFKRPTTSLTLEKAKTLFLRAFPLGFGDPGYLAPKGTGEREYKLAAHRRLVVLDAELAHLAESGTGSEIRAAIERIYRSPDPKEIQSLNLLHPQYEAPLFFDALKESEFARDYLKAARDFTSTTTPASFEALASVIERIPGKGSDPRVGKWSFFSWMPFIANPDQHMMIKPSIVQGFASILPFEIHYRAELDYTMYRLVLAMSERLNSRLKDTELNIARRQLDMIDMQSFMWVVQRYFEPAAQD